VRPFLRIVSSVERSAGTESELFLEATQALNRIFDRVDLFLKDDLLRGVFELLVASIYFPMVRPPCMRLGSACPSNPRSYLHEAAGHRLSPRT
jgi:hypothetical protein